MAIKSEDIANLSDVLNKMAQDGVSSFKKLEQQITGARKTSRAVAKAMQQHKQSMMKEYSQLHQEISRSIQDIDNLSDSEKENLKIKTRYNRNLKGQIESLTKATEATEDMTVATKVLATATEMLQGTMTGGLSLAITAITSAVTALVDVYGYWFDMQEKIQEQIGQMSMALGTTPDQLAETNAMAQQLTSTFANLTGEQLGLEAYEFTTELVSAFRNLNDVSGEVASTMLTMSRGFGLSAEEATSLFRLVTTGTEDPVERIREFQVEMMDFADSIGAPAGILMRDYAQAGDSIAQFGREGERTFRDASMMASRFGFETQKIFDAVRGFDTFNTASDNVNQLNAMFGTTISSFDMMMEQDPSQRLEMVRSAIMNMGLEWEDMNRFQRMQLSETLNMTERELMRVFQEGASFEELQRQQEQAAEEQRRQERIRQSNQERLNDLLAQTRTFIAGIEWYWERIKMILTRSLSPIFEVVLGTTQDIGRGLLDWVQALVESEEYQSVILVIADELKKLIEQIKTETENIDWKRVTRDVINVVKFLGEVVITTIEFTSWLTKVIKKSGIIGTLINEWNSMIQSGVEWYGWTVNKLEEIKEAWESIDQIVRNFFEMIGIEGVDALNVLNPIRGITDAISGEGTFDQGAQRATSGLAEDALLSNLNPFRGGLLGMAYRAGERALGGGGGEEAAGGGTPSRKVAPAPGTFSAPSVNRTISNDSVSRGVRERERVDLVAKFELDSREVASTELADALNRRSTERAVSNR